jgi:CheY-like chemotaxis protein
MPRMILIAAIDPNIIYLLQRFAEAAGFQTVHANQGKDIVELAQQTTPALIILENDFPGMVDCSVLHQLKDTAATREIPVVVYSCLDEEMGKPVEGVAGFLQKSVRYADFLAVVKQAGVHP